MDPYKTHLNYHYELKLRYRFSYGFIWLSYKQEALTSVFHKCDDSNNKCYCYSEHQSDISCSTQKAQIEGIHPQYMFEIAKHVALTKSVLRRK
jgi:hypothetical protein